MLCHSHASPCQFEGAGDSWPWGTSIRFFRGGQGSTCFPWSPIPGQPQCVRRSRQLDPLHTFPGSSPACPAEPSAEQCQAAVLSLEHRAQGGSRARGGQAFPLGCPCKRDSCLLFPRQVARPCMNLAVDPLCPAPSLLVLSPDWNFLRGDFLPMLQCGLDNCSCPRLCSVLAGELAACITLGMRRAREPRCVQPSADPACPESFAVLPLLGVGWGQLGARRSGFVEGRLLPPPSPALQTESWLGRGALPTRRAAGSQAGCVVFAGSTSPSSMQTKCTSHQLAPEEQEEVTACTSSCWIEIKGERGSRDSYSPWAVPTPGITQRNLQPPSYWVIVQDLYLNLLGATPRACVLI